MYVGNISRRTPMGMRRHVTIPRLESFPHCRETEKASRKHAIARRNECFILLRLHARAKYVHTAAVPDDPNHWTRRQVMSDFPCKPEQCCMRACLQKRDIKTKTCDAWSFFFSNFLTAPPCRRGHYLHGRDAGTL